MLALLHMNHKFYYSSLESRWFSIILWKLKKQYDCVAKDVQGLCVLSTAGPRGIQYLTKLKVAYIV
jgi:hypothetical protein